MLKKHGLTSRDLTIPPSDRPEVELQTSLYRDLRPEGALETETLDKYRLQAARSFYRALKTLRPD